MGRPGKPWFRASRNRWYAKVGGELVNLNVSGEENEPAAWAAYGQFVAALKSSPTPGEAQATPQPPPGAGEGKAVRPGTVADLIPVYLSAVEIKPKTRTDYADRLAWLAARHGGETVPHLDAEVIEQAARREGWTANTRRQTLQVIQGFVRWCRRADFALKLPAVESRGDEAVITPGQFRRALAFARGDFEAYLRLLWLTGCRPGEGCNVTAECVRWEARAAVLREHKTARKGRRRVITLGPDALALLAGQRLLYPTGPLFRGQAGVPFAPTSAARRWTRCADLAGIGGRTLYCLRHTFITRALESGVSDSDVATLVGHSGTAMIHKHYAHLTANAKRLRQVAAGLDGASPGAGERDREAG